MWRHSYYWYLFNEIMPTSDYFFIVDNFNSVEPHAPYTKIPSSTPLSGTSANPALITYPPTMELIFEGQVCRCWHSSNSFYWNTSTSYIIISSTHRLILTTQIPCNQCVMCKDFDEPTFKYCNQQLETAHLFTNRRYHFWRPGEYHFMKYSWDTTIGT